MQRRELLIAATGAALGGAAPLFAARTRERDAVAQAPPSGSSDQRARWLATAESLKPSLSETDERPLALVRPVPDSALVLRFRMETEAPAAALGERLLGKGDSFILDFGGHRTGHLSFELVGEGRGVDAPARLRFTFGEVATDVAEPLYPYQGQLSSSWLPDETVNVDFLPQQVRLPRRYAFRYVKVEVIDTSSTFKVRFRNVRAHALTSATGTPAPLATGSELVRRIDEVSIATLRDCMQTTFEDGPRRDQRLWVGDLRLQALANYATFQRNDLVKRCLYLFAALPREDGLVAACVYEKPRPLYGGIHIFDYALLYNVALRDYVRATGDLATGRELWPVALRQIEILGRTVGADGLFVDPREPLAVHRLEPAAPPRRGDPGRARLRPPGDARAGARDREGTGGGGLSRADCPDEGRGAARFLRRRAQGVRERAGAPGVVGLAGLARDRRRASSASRRRARCARRCRSGTPCGRRHPTSTTTWSRACWPAVCAPRRSTSCSRTGAAWSRPGPTRSGRSTTRRTRCTRRTATSTSTATATRGAARRPISCAHATPARRRAAHWLGQAAPT